MPAAAQVEDSLTTTPYSPPLSPTLTPTTTFTSTALPADTPPLLTASPEIAATETLPPAGLEITAGPQVTDLLTATASTEITTIPAVIEEPPEATLEPETTEQPDDASPEPPLTEPPAATPEPETTELPEATDSAAPTPTVGVPAEGIVRYQSRQPDHAGIRASVRDAAGTITSAALTDAAGRYLVHIPLDAPYTLVLEAPLFVRVTLDLPPGAPLPAVALPGGDLNADGCVGPSDFALVTSRFESTASPETDITNDGVTDAADLVMLAGNFDPLCEAPDREITPTPEATATLIPPLTPDVSATPEPSATPSPEDTAAPATDLPSETETTPALADPTATPTEGGQ
jgi:hypothetical protein